MSIYSSVAIRVSNLPAEAEVTIVSIAPSNVDYPLGFISIVISVPTASVQSIEGCVAQTIAQPFAVYGISVDLVAIF